MIAYIGLGSNRNARAHLEQALRALPQFGVEVRRVSAFRWTRPQAATGRAPFLNAVAEVETPLPPHVLLGRLHAVERLGRRRRRPKRGKNQPRTCDLDLLLYGRARFHTRALTLPHPYFAQRRFVLAGLAELAPTLHAPGSLRSMSHALRRTR